MPDQNSQRGTCKILDQNDVHVITAINQMYTCTGVDGTIDWAIFTLKSFHVNFLQTKALSIFFHAASL